MLRLVILLTQVFDIELNSSAISEAASRLVPAIESILNTHDWSTISPTAYDPGMRNQAAREFILSGRQLMFRGNVADFDASIRCLEKAIQMEPDSSIAHAYLSSPKLHEHILFLIML